MIVAPAMSIATSCAWPTRPRTKVWCHSSLMARASVRLHPRPTIVPRDRLHVATAAQHSSASTPNTTMCAALRSTKSTRSSLDTRRSGWLLNAKITPYQPATSNAEAIRRNEAGVRVEGTGMGTDSTRARTTGALRLLLLAGVLVASVVLSGCDVGSLRQDPTENSTRILGRRAWVIVTTDGGRNLVTRHSVPLQTGDSALDVLAKVADVRLDPNGTIAQVNGKGGGALGTFGPKQEAWFYRVDGIESRAVEPSRFRVRPGMSIWWDLRRVDIYDRLPVAVGTFPEPLFSGWRDSKRPLRIAYGSGFEKDAEFIRTSMFQKLNPDLVSLKGNDGVAGIGGEDNGRDKRIDTTLAVRRGAANLVIGRYEEIRLDPFILDINLDNRGYGITSWIEGTEIWRQDPDMEFSQRLANAEGLVWASTTDGEPDSTIVFVVTGTTDDGVRAALRALRSGACQFYLSCAVDRDGSVIR